MSVKERSRERVKFLDNLMTTAIENYGYGWFYVHEYAGEGETLYAVIEDEDEPGDTYRVDLDTFAKGLGVIDRAELKVDPEFPNDGEVLHNSATGQRLYMSQRHRKRILTASRTNGDEGDIDVVDALAVLECALFGRVVNG
ncbi:hypothetical protein ACFOOK_26415 [Micromonospora krabiensis]|uniref:Uncharacterized protein n=1 Tax=Micromonospora krabiensis TaxID=307121 RepID=A0A1C3N5Q1_9ACTN|nr:hypothetical protein [Micromonospora krabiensis]SBV27898.1 hypothetical protein GA0070620_3429 [Micromonospora krabiensis]